MALRTLFALQADRAIVKDTVNSIFRSVTGSEDATAKTTRADTSEIIVLDDNEPVPPEPTEPDPSLAECDGASAPDPEGASASTSRGKVRSLATLFLYGIVLPVTCLRLLVDCKPGILACTFVTCSALVRRASGPLRA